MHIYCWDLDKTYLQTDIHSVRGMIRTALEDPEAKQNVPGSANLVRALSRYDPSAQVMFVSGSPEQLRGRVKQKFHLDGVQVAHLILKDNLDNFRRRRFRAMREQVGYKLPRLLEHRIDKTPADTVTLFGDDSEVDALVYTLFAHSVSGQLPAEQLETIMTKVGAYPDAIQAALSALTRIEPCDVVEDIFIHIDRGVPLAVFDKLGGAVTPVFSWFQAALVLWSRKRLDGSALHEVIRACSGEHPCPMVIAGWVQDIVRRGHLSDTLARAAMENDAGVIPCHKEVFRALDDLPEPPVRHRPTPKYIHFHQACATIPVR